VAPHSSRVPIHCQRGRIITVACRPIGDGHPAILTALPRLGVA
jgi:hypothetical protein